MKMSGPTPTYNMCNYSPTLGPRATTPQPNLGHNYNVNSPIGASPADNKGHVQNSGHMYALSGKTGNNNVHCEQGNTRVHCNLDQSSRIHPNVMETSSTEQRVHTGHSQKQKNADSVKQCAGCGMDIIDRWGKLIDFYNLLIFVILTLSLLRSDIFLYFLYNLISLGAISDSPSSGGIFRSSPILGF